MQETLIQQIIRIAADHGFKAREVAGGAVRVEIPATKNGVPCDCEVEFVRNLFQLKAVLGY